MCRSSRVISGAAQLSRRHAWENDGTLIFLTEGHTRSTGQPPLRFWGLPCVKRGLAAFAGSGGEAARLFLQPWPRPQIRWSIAAAVLVCPFQQPARVHGIYSPAFGTVARPPRRPLLVKTSHMLVRRVHLLLPLGKVRYTRRLDHKLRAIQLGNCALSFVQTACRADTRARMRSWLRLVKHHRVRARCEVSGGEHGPIRERYGSPSGTLCKQQTRRQ